MNEILHLFYTVINREQGLQSPSLQYVGELHVNRFHRASVLQYPVLVQVGGIIVAWSAEGTIASRNYLQKRFLLKADNIFNSLSWHNLTVLQDCRYFGCFHVTRAASDQRHRIHSIKGKIHYNRVLCTVANFRISTLGCNGPDYSQLFFFIWDRNTGLVCISIAFDYAWWIYSIHFVRYTVQLYKIIFQN